MQNSIKIIFGLVFFTFAAMGPAGATSLRYGIAAYSREDFVTAAKYFLNLAHNGNPTAQTYLGFMYATGRGVPQNLVMSAYWYHCAAEAGDPTAQYMLGLMYEKGQGVAEDYVEAHKWLNLATAHSRLKAREYSARLRDAVATKMTLPQLAESRARALEWTLLRPR